MNRSLAPLHFKRPAGDKRRFNELRHHFAESPTAQHLIDYAQNTDIHIIDDTRQLEAKKLGGTYEHKHRRIAYSHHAPAYNLFHEIRHAQQSTTLEHEAPEILDDRFGLDLRRVFMTVAMQETDACYHQQLVFQEMEGRREKCDAPFYFRIFMGSYIEPWLASAAAQNLTRKSVFRHVSNPHVNRTLQMLELYYDHYCLRDADTRLPHPPLTAAERKAEYAYLERYSDLICRNPEGKNYLLDGSNDTSDKVIDSIWRGLFSKGRMAPIHLSLEKDRQREYLARKLNWMGPFNPFTPT